MVTFKWSLGITNTIQVKFDFDRSGVDGVECLGMDILSGGENFSQFADLLSQETSAIEEFADELLTLKEREVEEMSEEEEYAQG